MTNKPLTCLDITRLKKGDTIYIIRKNTIPCTYTVKTIGVTLIRCVAENGSKTNFYKDTGHEDNSYQTIVNIFRSKQAYDAFKKDREALEIAKFKAEYFLKCMSVSQAKKLTEFITKLENERC